jgi:hypothetical protein
MQRIENALFSKNGIFWAERYNGISIHLLEAAQLMMARNFREPKSAVEENLWLKETTPRNTRNSTKWSLKIFEEWQLARSNKVARSESFGFRCENIEEIQNLTVRITEMHPASLNFWMTKFVGEVMNQSGGRYPPRTLYQIVCGLNRHLLDINAENSVNMLSKGDQR